MQIYKIYNDGAVRLPKNAMCLFVRFIEGNKIETITKYALRGLRDLTHL